MAPGYLPTGATTEATTWPPATYQQGPPQKLPHGPWLLTNRGHHRSYSMALATYKQGPPQKLQHRTWLVSPNNRGHQNAGSPRRPTNRGHHKAVANHLVATQQGPPQNYYMTPSSQPIGAATELLYDPWQSYIIGTLLSVLFCEVPAKISSVFFFQLWKKSGSFRQGWKKSKRGISEVTGGTAPNR